MSAFMVDREHIDLLVGVALEGPASVPGGLDSPAVTAFPIRWYAKQWHEVDDEEFGQGYRRLVRRRYAGDDDFNRDPSQLGQLLVDANLESIHARYPDTVNDPDGTPRGALVLGQRADRGPRHARTWGGCLMANYHATARSNYFRVTDRARFETAIAAFPDLSVVDDPEGRVGLLCDQGDFAGWPSGHWDDESEEWIDGGIPELVASHLADDEVAIFMEAGAEKLRYVSGFAIAINAAGERREIALHHIYPLAAELGANVTEAIY